MYKMADPVIAEVMNLLEAEPSSTLDADVVSAITQPGPDIPAPREQLAIPVFTGKAKEAIGVHLTHEEVKRLTDKGVQKYYKRYETYVGAKTTETSVDSFLSLYTRAVGMFAPIKDVEVLQNDLKKDYIINKELSTFVGNLELRCGRMTIVAKTALITTKHVDFDSLRPVKNEIPVAEPVLYYLHDGPKRGFVREELLVAACLCHVKLDRLGVYSVRQHPAFFIISAQTQLLLLISSHPTVDHAKYFQLYQCCRSTPP